MKFKYIIMILIIISIILISFFGISKFFKKEKQDITENIYEYNYTYEETSIEKQNKSVDNIMVIGITEEQDEQVKEPPKKDASQLTQEIYDINGPIGVINIPKTGVSTQIYSNVTVDKMEQMPCFLYTTGGLNDIGITLFVGHNRKNGTLFSDNGKLKEGDIFYFTDLNGTELKYTIYNKFITDEGDISFLNEEVEKPTIALSCCTDNDDDYRIILLGRSD